MKTRILELETVSEIIESPGFEDLRAVISTLDGKENYFAILKLNDMTYLQTSNWQNRGFFLEYQDGSLEEHFQVPAPLKRAQVEQAFFWYAANDGKWKSAFLWRRMPLGSTDGARKESAGDKNPSEVKPSEIITIADALILLGLQSGATKEQLQKSFRERITKCHPDRVEHLDPEFKQLAEEKAKQLNRAYSILLAELKQSCDATGLA